MRVALNALPLGQVDGTGSYTRELLRAAARLEQAGAEPLDWRLIGLFGQTAADPDPLPRRSTRHEAAPPPWVRGENPLKLWFEQVGAPAAARAAGADLLHYPYFAAPLRAGTPVIATVHDLIPLLLPEYRGSALVRAYMQLQAVAARRARLLLTDSNHSRHDIVRLLGVPRQRVRVVPLGVDPRFRPAPAAEVAAVRARHGLPERFILYMGGLDARKNVERLVLAYARARASHGVGEPLALTGNADRVGPLFPPLRRLVARLGIDAHVRFLGVVPDADQPALCTACSLFVFPSRYEGFGLPVLEAMACGAVVACSDASSLPEVAGDAALRFGPDDELAFAESIARGLQDEPLRRTLAERALAQAARFTWERTARLTLEAYRAALAPPC